MVFRMGGRCCRCGRQSGKRPEGWEVRSFPRRACSACKAGGNGLDRGARRLCSPSPSPTPTSKLVSCSQRIECRYSSHHHRHRRPCRELLHVHVHFHFHFHQSRVLRRTALDAAANHGGLQDISVLERSGTRPLVAIEASLFRCTGSPPQTPRETTLLYTSTST